MANIADVRLSLGESRWRERYERLAEEVQAAAPTARPVLMSSTVVVDDIYVMTAARLESLQRVGATDGGHAATLTSALAELLSQGRDGELFVNWGDGRRWLGDVLGPPDRVQVGGTAPQAAWALDLLGATTVMALESRSPEQMRVLAPNILVCRDGRTVPVRDVPSDADAKPIRNEILEFPCGTSALGARSGRSHRTILRFSPIRLERDEQFMAVQEELGPKAGAALLSGLNGLAAGDRASMEWAHQLLSAWRQWGPALRHVELGDTPRPEGFKAIIAGFRGLVSSLGLSLSELSTFWGSSRDVAAKACELALGLECPCVVVHADRWSLAVHRIDSGPVVRRLMTGNLLAAARAVAGAPRGDLGPAGHATYDEDVPPSGRLDKGWRVDCVPSPFVPRPTSTIGLGDTFTAGLLLAAAMQGGAR